MSVRVRAASLQDGVSVLSLLETVGYYPEPLAFAKTYRKAISDPNFLVRVAIEDGKVVGLASLSMRNQLGLGGLVASLDELVIGDTGERQRVNKVLLKETVGKARALGARRIVMHANEGTPPPRAAQLAKYPHLAKTA
jgi:N-acetylglutamate synthase-like GNAT family acetyltransferase